MADRVFLHIGLPKTGTTYLQQLLWANKEALADAGVLLPGRHQRRHLLASLDVRRDPALARRSGDVEAPWQELLREIEGWPHTALISHEFFAPASIEQAKQVVTDLADAEVHLIVTARAMVDLGISRWQEWIRNGGLVDIDSFPASEDYDPADEWGWSSVDLADVLSRWRQVVPDQRIHVIAMAPGRSAPDELWTRFSAVLGVAADAGTASPSEDNRSLGLVETELLRRINPHLTGFRSAGDRGRWIRSYLAGPGLLAEVTTGERFRPGPAKLADLEARGRRAVALLADGGFDVVGDLALLEPSDVSALRHPSDVGADEMLGSAVLVIAELLERVREVTRERNDLHRQWDQAGWHGRLRRLGRRVASSVSTLRAARTRTDRRPQRVTRTCDPDL